MAKDKVNKSAAMREALETLGVGADNDALKGYLKEKHNLTLTESVFSNYKSIAKKKLVGGGSAKKAVSAEAPAVANGRREPWDRVASVPGVLQVVRDLKKLAAACGGKEGLKSLIDELL